MALLAFGQYKAQLLWVLPFHLRRLEGFAVETQAVAQACQQLARENFLHIERLILVGHAHQILFFHVAVFANQLAGYSAILGQHQHAYRVDVQAACRGQSTQL